MRGHLNTSQQGSNSELFAHENDALTARPQFHDKYRCKTINNFVEGTKPSTKTLELDLASEKNELPQLA